LGVTAEASIKVQTATQIARTMSTKTKHKQKLIETQTMVYKPQTITHDPQTITRKPQTLTHNPQTLTHKP
jgi:hypothetical protein